MGKMIDLGSAVAPWSTNGHMCGNVQVLQNNHTAHLQSPILSAKSCCFFPCCNSKLPAFHHSPLTKTSSTSSISTSRFRKLSASCLHLQCEDTVWYRKGCVSLLHRNHMTSSWHQKRTASLGQRRGNAGQCCRKSRSRAPFVDVWRMCLLWVVSY